MNMIGVMVLVVGLLPQDEDEVDQHDPGDRRQLTTVSDGVSRGRAEGPTHRHTQQHPDHLTLG